MAYKIRIGILPHNLCMAEDFSALSEPHWIQLLVAVGSCSSLPVNNK